MIPRGVFVSQERAAPYAKVTRPVSTQALGLIVLGNKGMEGARVQARSLRFMAQLISSSEPLLLTARLYQIGDSWVAKYQPDVKVSVELDSSCAVRILAFRDECPDDWTQLAKAPVKAIIDRLPLLRTCKIAGCGGCGCSAWHGVTSPGEPQALLEVWGRMLVKKNLKQDSPASSSAFSFFARIPAALLEALLSHGLYVEPGDAVERKADDNYPVVWLPRAQLAEATLLRRAQLRLPGSTITLA